MASASKTTGRPRVDFTATRATRQVDATGLGARDERDGEHYSDADLTDYDLTAASFVECEFTAVTLTNAQLRGVRFIETLITASFAPALLAARTTWRDVLVENPRGVRPNFSTPS